MELKSIISVRGSRPPININMSHSSPPKGRT